MVMDIEKTLKDVEYMKQELEQASIHLERALFTKNRIKKEYVTTEKFIQEMVKHYNPPTDGMERR